MVTYNIDNYRILDLISRNSGSSVYHVEIIKEYSNHKHTFKLKNEYAMKIVKGDNIFELGDFVECDFVNQLDHPSIIKSYDTFVHRENDKSNGYCIVMPLAKCSIYTIVFNSVQIASETKLDFMYQLITGVNYLHQNDIVHGDLKPNNILMYQTDGKYIIKIADFGTSARVITSTGKVGVRTTPGYNPPEILKESCHNSMSRDIQYLGCFEIDIWSLGMIFLEICRQKRIFNSYMFDDDMLMLKTINNYLDSDWKSESIFTGIIEDAPSLLERMLDRNPETRITIQEVLNHPIFEIYRKISISDSLSPSNSTLSSISKDNIISSHNRDTIIDWMEDVIDDYFSSGHELFLAIDIFDRYIQILSSKNPNNAETKKTQRKLYQLYAIVAINLSSWLVSNCMLSINDYIKLTNNIYTNDQFNDSTFQILTSLNWKIYRSTIKS